MVNSDFGIEKVVATSYWKVHAVPIGTDGKIYTVELCTALSDNGASRNQDQWAQVSKAELAQGRFGYLSAPEVSGLAHTLRVNKDNPKSRCHSFVKDGRIQFLLDCYHRLKGQTIELPDIDAKFKEEFGE